MKTYTSVFQMGFRRT